MTIEAEWKSPRKVEEEIREYKARRFESYMQMEDDGKLSRAMAIAAFLDEMDNPEADWNKDKPEE